MKVDFLSSHPKHGRKHGNDIIQLLQETKSGNSDSKGTKLLIRPNNSMLNTVYIKKKNSSYCIKHNSSRAGASLQKELWKKKGITFFLRILPKPREHPPN